MNSKPDPLIKASALAAGYKGKIIWRNASFSVEPGEFIGMLGPNGAGKSTLMNIILGLIKPIEGEIEVLGTAPRKGNNLIGYVPQRRNLDFDSRIQAVEYVKLDVAFSNWGFSLPTRAKAERTAAMEALKLVDGEDLAEKALYELSGGEAQRVFLAQALVGKPKLLLLDEPLANLDIKRGNQLIRLIRRVARQNNIAVILIAHDINPLLTVADRIIYIANGKVASGELASIITSKSLSRLYNAPIEVLKDSKGRLAVLGVEEAMHHDH